MKRVLRSWVVLAVLGLVSVGRAQDDTPTADAIKRAADEFALGKQAYRSEDYVEAAEHFEAADDNAPSVNALRAAMTSRSNAGQLDRAATLAALAHARHPDDENLAEEVQAILAEAATSLHRVSVTCDFPCSLVVGTSLVHGGAATDHTVYLNPGEHEIRASWTEEYGTESKNFVAIAGGSDSLEFTRPEPRGEEADERRPGTDEFGMDIEEDRDSSSEGPPVSEGHGPRPGWFIGGVVLTAALGGVTTWSGIDTQNNPGTDEVRRLCQDNPNYPDPTTCPAYQTGQNKELRTNVLIGATAAIGVTTIIVGALTDWHAKRTAVRRDHESAAARPEIRPWVELDQRPMVGVRGRF
jgi:hypothetical protein